MGKRFPNHYALRAKAPFVYCYIRKNGCSAFKRLFVERSGKAAQRDPGESEIRFMTRFHRAHDGDIGADYPTVLVVRDPFERLVSAFLNQIVMRLSRDGSEFGWTVEAATGRAIGAISFRELVRGYILPASPDSLDGHVRPQVRHLAAIRYTHAVPLSHLEEAMASILGEESAATYFGRPTNATAQFPTDKAAGAEDMSAAEIARVFAEKSVLPDKSAFADAKLIEEIDAYYAGDRRLFNDITDRPEPIGPLDGRLYASG